MIELFEGFDELSDSELEECVSRLQREVDEGKVDACWQLASFYENGRVVQRDARRAFQLREQGALADEPNAVFWLGYSYEHAVGARYDLQKAIELYDRALQGDSDFQSRVFACCQFSIYKIFKRVTSFKLLEKELDGETYYETHIETDAEGSEDERLTAIYAQCKPSVNPFYCAELAEIMRKLGEPKESCEVAASQLDAKAAELFEDAAERGNAVAAGKLAEYYGHGKGVEEDGAYAMQLTRRAADAGYAPAIVMMGFVCEFEGLFDEALEHYLRAAELDCPDGLCKAGLRKEALGETEEALRLFRRGAQLNHGPSLFFLGRSYWADEKIESKENAVECWRRSAELGFPLAMERYAAYLSSDLDEASPREAWAEVAEYYRRAMEEGVDTAKVNYACMLHDGLGVEKDLWESAWLLNEISQEGDTEAKELLAARKFEGDGCDRDPDGAFELLQEAAQESTTAQIALGFRYFFGDGVLQDYFRAARLFGEAAKSGASIALINFARCCFEGLGVFRNDLAGEYFLRLAAEQGDPIAAYRLGLRFASGEYGPEDWRLAMQWFHVASASQDALATERLAFGYWNGLGVERDRVLGAYLWELADDYGDEEALEELERAESALYVEQLFSESEDPHEAQRDAAVAEAMGIWMESRTSASGDFPSRAEFVNEYKLRVDAFGKSNARPVATVSKSGGAVQALLKMYRACAAADATRSVAAEGMAFEP